MKNLAITAINRRVIRHRRSKTAQQHIAGQRLIRGYPVKSFPFHIVKVVVFAVVPPVIFTRIISKLDAGQMVCIPDQGPAVHYTVLKLAACQMRHAAEFMNFIVADQPPRKRRLDLQRAVSTAEER